MFRARALCGCMYKYGYDCLYVYVSMCAHVCFIIKLIDVLIIYLINTYIHGFGFKIIYTPIYFLGLYNSSFHNLVIHYIKTSIVAIQLKSNEQLVKLAVWPKVT